MITLPSQFAKAYAPTEPRDERGRWTSGVSSGAAEKVKAAFDSMPSKPIEDVHLAQKGFFLADGQFAVPQKGWTRGPQDWEHDEVVEKILDDAVGKGKWDPEYPYETLHALSGAMRASVETGSRELYMEICGAVTLPQLEGIQRVSDRRGWSISLDISKDTNGSLRADSLLDLDYAGFVRRLDKWGYLPEHVPNSLLKSYDPAESRDESGKWTSGESSDAITGKATVGEITEATQTLWKKWMGRLHPLTPSQAIGLVGAPDGAKVSISRERGSRGPMVTFLVEHPLFREPGYYTVYQDQDGYTVLRNEAIWLDDAAPRGMGTRMLAKQISVADKLGVSRIELDAERGEGENGYYTWPRLGFDGPPSWRAGVDRSSPFVHAKRVSEVMGTPEGRAFYREWGDTSSLSFDLDPGSGSRRMFDAYTASRTTKAYDPQESRDSGGKWTVDSATADKAEKALAKRSEGTGVDRLMRPGAWSAFLTHSGTFHEINDSHPGMARKVLQDIGQPTSGWRALDTYMAKTGSIRISVVEAEDNPDHREFAVEVGGPTHPNQLQAIKNTLQEYPDYSFVYDVNDPEKRRFGSTFKDFVRDLRETHWTDDAGLEAVARSYDPSESRDEHGRWTGGGDAAQTTALQYLTDKYPVIEPWKPAPNMLLLPDGRIIDAGPEHEGPLSGALRAADVAPSMGGWTRTAMRRFGIIRLGNGPPGSPLLVDVMSRVTDAQRETLRDLTLNDRPVTWDVSDPESGERKDSDTGSFDQFDRALGHADPGGLVSAQPVGGSDQPTTGPENVIHQMLTMIQEIHARNQTGGGSVYTSDEDLLLKNGRYYKAQPLPEGFGRAPAKQCYRNAAQLALTHPDLTYVEGYGMSIIPTPHAWVVDKAGNVIDPTWDTPQDAGYFGVPIPTDDLATILTSKKTYGVLGDYTKGFPELQHAWDPHALAKWWLENRVKPRRTRKAADFQKGPDEDDRPAPEQDEREVLAWDPEQIELLEPMHMAKFDPSESRDEAGKWTDEGSDGSPSKESFRDIRFGAASWGRKSFQEVHDAMTSRSVADLVKFYKYDGYAAINGVARGKGSATDYGQNEMRVVAARGALDRLISRGVVPENVTVWRGLGEDAVKGLDKLVGHVVADPGFLSTEIAPRQSVNPQAYPARLRIHVPKGAHAMYLDYPDWNGGDQVGESELLLGRNTHLRILGYDPKVRQFECEVVR